MTGQSLRIGGGATADVAGAGPSRRDLLTALALSSVAVGAGTALRSPALTSAPWADPPTTNLAAAELVRGGERRFNAPWLMPGTRLVMPKGVQAVPVERYLDSPRLAPTTYSWPTIPAVGGAMVDASVIPAKGAASRVAVLSGFTDGWYEVVHPSGAVDRVEWDATKLPSLWFFGEFGATTAAPFMGQFYTLALEPFSRNPIQSAS